ncbi:MAG: hypothetical protein IPK33_11690 [Gemmatimonadetes bacterium]|nr:hypothetical protein [Gemmatimonadota bacterium]
MATDTRAGSRCFCAVPRTSSGVTARTFFTGPEVVVAQAMQVGELQLADEAGARAVLDGEDAGHVVLDPVELLGGGASVRRRSISLKISVSELPVSLVVTSATSTQSDEPLRVQRKE